MLADSWNNFFGFSFFLADGDDSPSPSDFNISSTKEQQRWYKRHEINLHSDKIATAVVKLNYMYIIYYVLVYYF